MSKLLNDEYIKIKNQLEEKYKNDIFWLNESLKTTKNQKQITKLKHEIDICNRSHNNLLNSITEIIKSIQIKQEVDSESE